MRLFRRKKSRWQRIVKPVSERLDTKTLTRPGLTAAVSLVGLTAASAVVSSLRRTEDR